jgi:large subunit ribosomal protein L9
MKVILTTDVPKLGKQGDVVQVSDGYARNFLLPRNMAIEASASRLHELEQKHRQLEKKKKKEEQTAQMVKEQIDGQTVVVKARCGESGKLFGAVTSKEIADAIKTRYKVDIDKKRIEIKEPIKQLGEYPVRIRLHQKAIADVKVRVEEE